MLPRTLRVPAGLTAVTILAFSQALPSKPNPAPANALAPVPERNVGQVIGPANLIFSVSDLGRSVAFYREALGLVMRTQPGHTALPPAAPLDEMQSNLTDTRGARFRTVTFDLPDAGFGLELVEFTGIERKPSEPRS
jgi:hypothetical protein